MFTVSPPPAPPPPPPPSGAWSAMLTEIDLVGVILSRVNVAVSVFSVTVSTAVVNVIESVADVVLPCITKAPVILPEDKSLDDIPVIVYT